MPKGKNCQIFKKPLRPSRLVVRPKFTETLGLIGKDTNFILMHARATTVGNTRDNRNNHPIIASSKEGKPVIGIHNGTLYNHENLFRRFKNDIDREGEVDSEIIFRLYQYYLTKGMLPEDAIKKTTSLLQGAFTGAAVDLNHPHQMVMFKFDRPLAVLRIPHYDMIITVSEAKYYDVVRKRLGIKAKDELSYPREGTGTFVDLNREGRIVNQKHIFELPIDKKTIRRIGNSRWVSNGYL